MRSGVGMSSPEIIALVACVSKKGAVSAPAKELYQSPWFKAARRYVEHQGVEWFILSAKHHLMGPEQVIEPYNESLVGMKASQRQVWATLTAQQIRQQIPQGTTLLVLAGKNYREYLLDQLPEYGSIVPMAGLGIGQQVQWLQQQVRQEIVVK